LLSKRRQKDALRRFAELLKWPNMDEIEYVLKETDPDDKPLEDRSADTMAWFTGVILPGPTLPFLVMNALIDSDRDTGEALQFLSHVYPHAGFQYRANTYWSTSSILGKVLGAGRGVKSVAGWVGPCLYTPDLERTQCALLRQTAPKARRKLGLKDIESMADRSNPLGSKPKDDLYAVSEYEEWLPSSSTHSSNPDNEAYPATDVIRVEKLSLRESAHQNSPLFNTKSGRGARLYDATIIFAIEGQSHPLRLRHDVSFVSAFPCRSRPHALFWDYKFAVANIEDRLDSSVVRAWLHRNAAPAPDSRRPYQNPRRRSSGDVADSYRRGPDYGRPAFTDLEEVLVIEAYGVSDNEVFARSWCASRGLDALVANVKETCVGCAVREAYAACLGVVILTEGGKEGEVEVEVAGEVEDDGDSLGYGGLT